MPLTENLADLDERACSSDRRHGEHLLVVHQPGDAPDAYFRCPGKAEDDDG